MQDATFEAVEVFPAVHAVQPLSAKLFGLWYLPAGQGSHVSAVAEPGPLKNPALQDVECAVQVATGGKEDWFTVTLFP